jgi:hypothetical protein
MPCAALSILTMEQFAVKESVKSYVEVEISAFANKLSIGLDNVCEEVFEMEAALRRRDQSHSLPRIVGCRMSC